MLSPGRGRCLRALTRTTKGVHTGRGVCLRMFEIKYAESVERDLVQLRACHRNAILDAIDKYLAREPLAETRRRCSLAVVACDRFVPCCSAR